MPFFIETTPTKIHTISSLKFNQIAPEPDLKLNDEPNAWVLFGPWPRRLSGKLKLKTVDL